MKLNKIVTANQARYLIIDAVRLERDKARVERQSQDNTITALQRQVQALSDQQQAQTAARNVDAEEFNVLIEKNDNQRKIITDLQAEIENTKATLNEKTAIIGASERTETVEAQWKRISHLQDQMQEFDRVWEVLCEAVIDVANSEGYCEEFDSLVDTVNQELERKTNGYRTLQRRTKEFWVTLAIDCHIEEAVDEDDAVEQAKNNLDAGCYSTDDLDNYGMSVREE